MKNGICKKTCEKWDLEKDMNQINKNRCFQEIMHKWAIVITTETPQTNVGYGDYC